MRKCIISIDMLDAELNVCSIEDSEKYVSKYFGYDNFEYEKEYDGSVHEFTNKELGLHKWLVILPKEIHLRTLVHECIHAAFRVCEYKGITIVMDNQEPLAYLSDYLFAEILNKFYKINYNDIDNWNPKIRN